MKLLLLNLIALLQSSSIKNWWDEKIQPHIDFVVDSMIGIAVIYVLYCWLFESKIAWKVLAYVLGGWVVMRVLLPLMKGGGL